MHTLGHSVYVHVQCALILNCTCVIQRVYTLSRPHRSNPIVELFNGRSKTEGVLNGENFTNESRFGAFPVQVRGHTHLHDCLDAVTYTAELKQETWFTLLPPILVLELSRFQYNQASGQAEKVHDLLRFDMKMCLDRYLERNKEDTRRRRIEVKKLKEKLNELEGRLARSANGVRTATLGGHAPHVHKDWVLRRGTSSQG